MKTRARIYSIVAGLGFLAYVVLSILLSINVSGGGISLDGQQMGWLTIGLAFAVMYFIGKRQVGLLVVSAMAFIQDLTDFASDFREASMFAPETMSTAITDILEALAFAALFAMFLVSISAKLRKKPHLAGILGLAALILQVISDCVYWLGIISNSFVDGLEIRQLIQLVPYICVSLAVLGSSIFAVLWIVVEMKMIQMPEPVVEPFAPQFNPASKLTAQAAQPEASMVPEQPMQGCPQENGANAPQEHPQENVASVPQVRPQEISTRESEPTPVVASTQTETPETVEMAAKSLSIYKELLDNGLITQEDYDIKKRQILGL